MAEIYLDFITIAICYTLFWVIIIILILYPKLKLKKTLKRIKFLKKKH